MTKNPKDAILARLRASKLAEHPYPEKKELFKSFCANWEQFENSLKSVGGQFISQGSNQSLVELLKKLPVVQNSKKIYCPQLANELHSVSDEALKDPHLLENCELAILKASFAVAENGAVWLVVGDLPQRALPFICEYLILCVSKKDLVADMHEAYKRLDPTNLDYGVFISGPSKTADIEQSLVLGAHGPCSATVIALED